MYSTQLITDYTPVKISNLIISFILLISFSNVQATTLSDDILLKCKYSRVTSSNENISKLSPYIATTIFYLDPVGGSLYNENREKIEASIDTHRIIFNESIGGQTNNFNIDRQTGFIHLNKITTRDEMIKQNSSYNSGNLVETFEGECVQSNGGRQF
jgi:hypothetical protein